MAKVFITDKQIPLNEGLVEKFDLMIKRVTQDKPRLDNLTCVEGGEGVGKTTFSLMLAYYVHYKTGRPFSEKNVFADVKEAVDFAQNTEGQIIIFDEPALDALSADWWKQSQKDLIQLLMLARKKRHFFIFNITKFYKFAEYIVVDRATCMLHLYADPESNKPLFAYIGKSFLEPLYNDYRTKKIRNYRKYYGFRDYFPDVLDPEQPYNILDKFNVAEYEEKKDKAIQSIGKMKKNDVKELRLKIGSLTFPIKSMTELSLKLGLPTTTVASWRKQASQSKTIQEDKNKEEEIDLTEDSDGNKDDLGLI